MTIQDAIAADDETPEERQRKASSNLYEQEDYLRRQEYLSDDDLRDRMRESIRIEQKRIDSILGTEFYIMAGSGKIHLPTCPSVRQLLDQAAMWEPYLQDLERARDWHGSDNSPSRPAMFSRTTVETLEEYETCGLCVPPLNHQSKRRAPKNWQPLRAGSLGANHFDKDLFTGEDDHLGALDRVTTVLTKDGARFRAEFSNGQTITDPEIVVRYKKPSQTGLGKDPDRHGRYRKQ